MKYCTKCGAQNEDNALVCVKCNSSFSLPKSDINKIIGILVNALGITNGLASLILGIVTFTKTSLGDDFKYALLDEMGSAGNSVLKLLTAPAFALGSILVIVGMFIILYFTNRLIQKKK